MRRRWAVLAVGAAVSVLATGTAMAAPLGDIALHRPTAASSARSGHPAALAVDGDERTRWESAKSADPQWLSVDLGGLYHVNPVRLVWGPACARAYQVQTSRDAATWLTALSVGTGDGGVDDYLLPLTAPTFGRYVRVFATRPCRAGASYALGAVELFGARADEVPPTPPANLRVTGVTPSAVALAWDAGTDNVGVRGYQVYLNGVRATFASGTSTTVTGLLPNSLYSIAVTTVDRAYNESPPSAAGTAPPPRGEGGPPTPPTNPPVTVVQPPRAPLPREPSAD